MAVLGPVVLIGEMGCERCPLTHMGLKWGAQAFTGAPTTHPDTYPYINAAHDLADKIGVTKSALNLKQLENITERTYSDTGIHK